MQTKNWILTDVDAGVYLETWSTSRTELAVSTPAPDWSIQKRRLHGGLSDGVDLIEVDNGALRFSIVPTRGMGIWRGSFHGWSLGWQSPVRGPVHPGFVDETIWGGIGWLAGFDEWIVRCGLNSNGAPGVDVQRDNQGNKREMTVPLHGRIANLPAHYVEVRVGLEPPHPIEIIGRVDESALFTPQLRLETVISTTPGSAVMTIQDRVQNFKSQTSEMQLLYHCNFGPPLLSENSRLLAPIRSVSPRDERAAAGVDDYARFPAPTPGLIETAYFFDLAADSMGRTLAVLKGGEGDKACALRFSTKKLPCFTLWKNPAAESDGYAVGLEPATNYPNLKTFEREQGRVVKLPPGGWWESELSIEAVDTPAAMARIDAEVQTIQSSTTPTVHRSAIAKISSAAS